MCSPFLIYLALAGACKERIAQRRRLNKGSGMFAMALKVVQIVLDVVMIVCIIQLKKKEK